MTTTSRIGRVTRRVLVIIGIAFLAAGLDGCENGPGDDPGTPRASSATSSNTASGDTGEAAAGTTDEPITPNDGEISRALQRDLSARLVRPGELLGMTPSSAKRFLTPQELAMSDSRPGAARQYERERVEGAASLHLDSSRSADAISTVLRFRTAAGARSDLSTAADVPAADKATTFDVPGIPEAVGVDVYLDGEVVGRNVSFVAGPYEYIFGFEPDPAPAVAWTQEQTAIAAASWYDRVSAS